jgi:hypothetical protein
MERSRTPTLHAWDIGLDPDCYAFPFKTSWSEAMLFGSTFQASSSTIPVLGLNTSGAFSSSSLDGSNTHLAWWILNGLLSFSRQMLL